MLKYGYAMSATALTVPAADPSAPLQDALRHEAQAAYDARRLALLQKQHDELLAAGQVGSAAKEGAEAQQAARPADEETAASSAALAQQQGLVQSLRAEARGAATELEQLRVGGWVGGGAGTPRYARQLVFHQQAQRLLGLLHADLMPLT